jgi:hypothetical protein
MTAVRLHRDQPSTVLSFGALKPFVEAENPRLKRSTKPCARCKRSSRSPR